MLRPTPDAAKSLLSGLPVGVAAFALDGQCVFANEAMAELVGATVEQCLAQNFREVASWKASGLARAAERTLSSGEASSLDVHLVSTFGKELWTECHLTRRDIDGSAHLVLIATDITERKPSFAEPPEHAEPPGPLARLWGALTAPPPALPAHQREQARFLAITLLAVTPLIAVLGLGVFPRLAAPDAPYGTPVFGVAVPGTLALTLAYVASRRGHVAVGAALAVATCLFGPYGAAFSDPALLMFSTVGVALAMAFFSAQAVALLGVVVFAGTLLLPILRPATAFEEVIPFAGFNLMLPGLLLVVAWHRERAQRRGREELRVRNEELRAEIDRRREAETDVREHARLQELLVQEINHRVRNNLSAMLGILRVERSRASFDGQRDDSTVLDTLERRIRGISAVHDVLTENEWQEVPLSSLCERVLEAATGARAGEIEIEVGSSSLRTSSQQAQHLALVLAELAMNSLKYGTDADGSLHLRVELENEGAWSILRYRDGGPGYPDPVVQGERKAGSLGIGLVEGIVSHSLHGEVELRPGPGALTILRIPVGG